MRTFSRLFLPVILAFGLTACGGDPEPQRVNLPSGNLRPNQPQYDPAEKRKTFTDLLLNQRDPNVNLGVNKYLWRAAMDTLAFLPLEAADPFSGVIVTGWGRVSGSSGLYRATVYIQDAALDARSLRVAVFRRSGSTAVPVSGEVARRIEDAILTRARQLKVARAAR
ncbi:MAG: DUF3576 domain-containing protein [Paracoccaceae bacterium]